MGWRKERFGTLPDGQEADLYTLEAGDLVFRATNYGAIWQSLEAPDRLGKREHILLGYPDLSSYTVNLPYFGSLVGRYANRISRGAFSLNGKRYVLGANDGENLLHGGVHGFDKRLWRAEAYEEGDAVCLRMELDSPDGDGGFPGALRAAVTYSVNRAREVGLEYRALADAPCPVNLTSHGYFNLAGEGDVLSHEARIWSDAYLETNIDNIPTGKILPVAGTPFDFRAAKPIGRDMALTEKNGLMGYDQRYIIRGKPGELRPCGEFYEERSGRLLSVYATAPTAQFYTGNYLDALGGGIRYGGFCLETEQYPDAPNRREFPSAIFGPQREYYEKTLYKFETR